MPRTSRVEAPGCPPIRTLIFDVLGLVKVVETRAAQGGFPQVVDRWGTPDTSRSILATSMNDREFHPLVAVARKSGEVEVLSPLTGDVHVSIPSVCQDGVLPEDDAVSGLHLFKQQRAELSPKSCTIFTCTTKGFASMRSVEIAKAPKDSVHGGDPISWNVCSGGGNILCSKVDGKEQFAIFGGKRVEVNVWDLENCTKIWTAKSPPRNSLDIFTPTWFTSTTFLSKDDHRKFVAGTNSHQVRLYDISAQRRPIISFDFKETPIKAVTEDLDGHTVYVGNGSGDLASFDIRTGKLLGCFLGKCSGSIRSIARHPQLPLIASCGLDSYLRVWDIQSRQLLSAVFLKQHLTSVVFDSHFKAEEVAGTTARNPASEKQDDASGEISEEEEEMLVPVKRKKSSKEDHNGSDSKKKKKLKSKRKSKKSKGSDSDDDD
jgi:ribosome biogenesis protein NSA1